MRILEILTLEEQFAFDNPPNFTSEDQQKYFLLTKEINDWLKTISINTYKVGIVLMLGYARYTGKVFLPQSFKHNDITFVCKKLKVNANKIDLSKYSLRRYNYHKQKLFSLLHLQSFNNDALQIFTASIKNKISKFQSFKQIIYDVAYELRRQHIEIPNYSRFATIISHESNSFENKLIKIATDQLSQIQIDSLNKLLTQYDNGKYIITKLKVINQERSPAAINESVNDFKVIKDIYYVVFPIIEILGLHVDTVEAYATWVSKASLHQIQQLKPYKQYLHLICFINHQHCLRQDILADIFLLSVRSTQNTIYKEKKLVAFKQSILYKDTVDILSNSNLSKVELIKQIKSILYSKTSDSEKLIQLNKLVNEYDALRPDDDAITDITIKNNLNELASQNYYKLLTCSSQKLQNRVANIMRYLEFEANDTLIYKAITHYQTKSGNITKSAPVNFMNPEEQDALEDKNGKFSISLYKILLYIYTADALKSGIVSLKPSYRYLSLENYLYPFAKWVPNKDKILAETELTNYQNIEKLLDQLQRIQHQQFKITNKNILNRENTYIKFDTKGNIVIDTPKVEKPNLASTASLFVKCKYVQILKILRNIQQVTNFLSCLKHISVKDKQILPDENVFYAAILALGCNIGVSKIANVSRGISEAVLLNLVNWHISLDNVYLANQVILTFLDKLALTKIYQTSSSQLHSASDGRKIGVSVPSLNANTSYKYFGNSAGISNYSFIDNLNRVLYSTGIMTAEEVHHVIDGVLHDPNIKSTRHSTDTHGYSEVIFAIMYLLSIDFAPRIKGIKHSILYSFISRKKYETLAFKVLPDRYINEELIKSQWDNILRLVATIRLRETTASQILKRLSSYSKQHPLYCAIKEFGRIIKTIFILRFIDNVELRQSIQKQLNRIELSNKFANAISFDNDHELQYGSKEEQDIALNCQRLLQNIIILWNELYLSEKIASAETEEIKQQLIAIIANGSTHVWGHINLLGEYDFTENKANISFDLKKIMALQF